MNESKKLTAEIEAFNANRNAAAAEFKTNEKVTPIKRSFSYKKSGQL